MARGSQYTWEYRSTPEGLTRPYLIPPIEDDPFFQARQTRRSRREQSSMTVRGVEPHSMAGQSYEAGTASIPRTDAQGRTLSASQRRQLAQAQFQAAQAQEASAGRRHRPMRPASPTGAAPGGTNPRRRRGSVLGCLIPLVVILVIIGSFASPIIEGIIERLTPDDNSGPVTVSEFGAEPSTDEIIEMLGAADEHENRSFEAYAVVSDGGADGAYRATLSGYVPSSPEEIEWEAEAELMLGGDAGVAAGDLIRGEFVFDGDPDAYIPELSVGSWEPAEFHDVANDIAITETGRDDGEISYDVEFTNTADVERAYSVDIEMIPPEGSAVMEGWDYVSTEPIPAGEAVVVHATSYMFDIGDAHIEYLMGNPYRY